MDTSGLQMALLGIFNGSRQSRGLNEAFDADDLSSDLTLIGQKSASFILNLPQEPVEDVNLWIESQMAAKLDPNTENISDSEDLAELLSVVFEKDATHIGVALFVDQTSVRVDVQAFFFYLRLEPLGPMIDGDIVLQGYIVGSNKVKMGPTLCVVDRKGAADDIQEVCVITPDKMIISAPEDESSDEETRFIIPVHVEQEDRIPGATFGLRVYVQDMASIPYDGDVSEDFASKRDFVLASICVASAEVAAVEASDFPATPDLPALSEVAEIVEGENPPVIVEAAEDSGFEDPAVVKSRSRSIGSVHSAGSAAVLERPASAGSHGNKFAQLEEEGQVVQGVHIATDYDDIIALQSEGYVLDSLQVSSSGVESDQDFLWKFHVMVRYGDRDQPGIEDIQWVKCLKSLGTLPTLPFFKIMHDYDLSNPEGDYSVYLAYRMGPNPRFSKLVMLCSLPEHSTSVERYVVQQGATFFPAPDEVDRSFSGVAGLMLVPIRHGDAPSTPALEQGGRGVFTGGELERDDASHGDSSDEDYEEEDMVSALHQQLQEMEVERQSLQNLNGELQKKVVLLMAREKALQGQTVASRAGGSADVDVAAAAAIVEVAQAEQSVEKEKQYHEVLQYIVVERGKLNKQLKEFDQLALDLQTRLDDKEFKAKGIATSFKQFKKEILEKAQNSRTGHHLTPVQIQQVEGMEAKYEEELEKVRLRNISLRTTHKKLERTLRAREQLAEGLHMIDFEQLKIENQTLNEKIEERNEDLSKLKRKKTTTVQVLTHTREKLRFTEQANKVLQGKLSSLEGVITNLRNVVTTLKLQRDEIRGENGELKAKQSFATSDLLLADYENRKHQVDQMDAAVQELMHRYELLVKQVQANQALAGKPSTASMPWVGQNK